MSFYRYPLLTSLVLASALTVTACTAQPEEAAPTQAGSTSTIEIPDLPTDIPVPSPTADPSTEGIFSLSVGDCFDDEGHVLVDDVPTIDCAAPHDLEVFDEFDITATEFDVIAVAKEAQDGCKARFDAFLGLSYDESTLDLLDYHPTANTWLFGDRKVSCAMGDPAGKTSGSLRGAAR